MSVNFDPYHKWLGIAPAEQPPNHYRLLGLNLYESDPDVISNASERQMRHLRSFQIGPRVSDCQRLLNEVAGARVVLLDSQKKAAYDQTLRVSLAPPEAPPPVNAVPPAPAAAWLPTGIESTPPPTAVPVSNSTGQTSPVLVAKRTRRRRKQPISVGTLVFGGMIGVFVLAACGYGLRVALQAPARPIPQQAEKRPAKITPPPQVASVEPAERPAASPPDVPVEPEVEPAAPSQPADDPDTKLAANGEPAQPPPQSGSLGDLVDSKEAAKLAVPDPTELQAAREELQVFFADDLDKQRTPQEAAAFADRLVDQAIQPGTQAATQYALFEIAIDIAAQGGAVASASRAFQELDKSFSVDLAQLKADAALKIARLAKEASEHKYVAELLEAVIDECLADDRYDVATPLAEAAIDAARKSKESATIARLAARSRDVKSLNAKYEPVRAALQVLADGSDDPAAHETIGRHLCLVKGKWAEGLPHLVQGDAAELRDVAAQDMRNPGDPESQAAIGDDWLKVASQLDRNLQLQALLRAEHWYRLALAQASGPKKLSLEEHINDLGKQVGELAELPPGAVLVMTFEPSTLKRQGLVLDVSQHGYIGEVHQAVFAEGIAGNALAFDGKDDYVEVASTPWLSAPPAFSFAAWVNVESWKNPRDAVDYVLSNESAGYLGYVLRYRDGGIANLTVGGSQWHAAVSTKKASLGEWHHMAATFDGQISSVFLDGELGGSLTVPAQSHLRPLRFALAKLLTEKIAASAAASTK